VKEISSLTNHLFVETRHHLSMSKPTRGMCPRNIYTRNQFNVLASFVSVAVILVDFIDRHLSSGSLSHPLCNTARGRENAEEDDLYVLQVDTRST
jgi:hypothetical protein